MADFCLATRMSPTEYRQLTLDEYKAFANQLSRGKGDTGWPQL